MYIISIHLLNLVNFQFQFSFSSLNRWLDQQHKRIQKIYLAQKNTFCVDCLFYIWQTHSLSVNNRMYQIAHKMREATLVPTTQNVWTYPRETADSNSNATIACS